MTPDIAEKHTWVFTNPKIFEYECSKCGIKYNMFWRIWYQNNYMPTCAEEIMRKALG